MRRVSDRVNEMVRRLIQLGSRWIVVTVPVKEDHRHADTFSGHRPWQDNLSPCSARRNRQGACAEEVHVEAVAGLHREHASLSDRPGGVLGAYFLGRALHKQRHDVRLIPAQFVKPFVKSNKDDFIDAEVIAEAVETMKRSFEIIHHRRQCA